MGGRCITVVIQTLSIMLLKTWDVNGKKENTFRLLPWGSWETYVSKYEYFFRSL